MTTITQLTDEYNLAWPEFADDAPPASVEETAMSRHLDGLRPGLPHETLNQHVFQYFQLLARDPTTSVATDQRIEELTSRLKQHGYSCSGAKTYRAMANSARKIVAAARHDISSDPGSTKTRKRFVEIDESTRSGIFDRKAAKGDGEVISNVSVVFDQDIEILDELESHRWFKGLIKIRGVKRPFEISSEDFASDQALRGAVFKAAGPEAQIHCDISVFRRAVSALSEGQVTKRRATSEFGWTAQGDVFLVPGGVITRQGFHPVEGNDELSVDLQTEENARHLKLIALSDPNELRRVKQHMATDLLNNHEPRVINALLGSVGAAILYRFSGDVGRFALWLTGLTGTGKSFVAKLFQNFFGTYPLNSGRFVTWASSANYIQRQGYFYKDALYLVDDYKPEVIKQTEVVRILQNYADGTGRGRLRVDATTNTTRPIRGLLVSTGEDIPEHSASAVSRSIIVTVPQIPKDLRRGSRCGQECSQYSAVTADFIRWLLENDRLATFQNRLQGLQAYFYRDIAGQQNGERIASNFAQLAAGFLEFMRFMNDVLPDWKKRFQTFLRDLKGIRDDMLAQVKHQQASEIFLATLRDLFRHQRVRINDGRYEDNRAPLIGKEIKAPANLSLTSRRFVQVSTAMALEAVQESLHKQGRPPLRVTERALLDQLRQDGKLLGPACEPLRPDDDATERVRINGARARCFIIDATDFWYDADIRQPETFGALETVPAKRMAGQ